MGFCASAALRGPTVSPCRLSFPQKSGKLEVEAAAEKRDIPSWAPQECLDRAPQSEGGGRSLSSP